MQRRTFLRRSLLLSACAALPACRREGLREEVLRALVEQVLVPNTAAISEASHQLEGAIALVSDGPSAATVQTARERWQRALLSWKRAEVFRYGPMAQTNASMRAMFWPVRTAALQALQQGTEEIDDTRIEAMGVDRRGLFALEYLLYSAEDAQTVSTEFVSPAGARRARLARALAANVALHADRVARSLGNGKKLADDFADAGQESLNRVVACLVDRVENVSARYLARVAALAKSGRLVATEIEGGRSGISQQIALTYLHATEQLYLGLGRERGLGALVAARSRAVDETLRAAFKDAIAALEGLGLPLETAVVREPAKLDSAASVVKKLERALKTELTSALGLTLTFSSLDGD